MYGEALRNWGAFLLFLALAFGAAGAVVWIAAGRWLRARLEAEYGKVCALPREAWITQEAAEQKENAAEQESGEEHSGEMEAGEQNSGGQEPETPHWTEERRDTGEQTPDQR